MSAAILPFPAVRTDAAERSRLIAAIARARNVFPLQVRADDRRRVKMIEHRATEALRAAGMHWIEIDAAVAAWRPE